MKNLLLVFVTACTMAINLFGLAAYRANTKNPLPTDVITHDTTVVIQEQEENKNPDGKDNRPEASLEI